MESERPIEKILRTAAKQRRQQASGTSFTLHPATRRLLQSEVTRQYPAAPAPAGWLAWFLPQWPRFAAAVALVAILALAVWTLLPDKHSSTPLEMAMTPAPTQPNTTARRQFSPDPANTPAMAVGKSALADKQTQAGYPVLNQEEIAAGRPGQEHNPLDIKLNAAGGQLAASAPVPTQQAEAGDELRGSGANKKVEQSDNLYAAAAAAPTERFLDKSAELQKGAVAEAPASAASAGSFKAKELSGQTAAGIPIFSESNAVGGKAVADTRVFGSVNRSGQEMPAMQQFTRAAIANSGKAQTTNDAPVLASFAVEQAGSELRVIDNDGSVYAGNLEVTAALKEPPAALGRGVLAEKDREAIRDSSPSRARLKSAPTGQTAPQFLYFRVAGTNRTLNQNVVFFGNFTQPVPVSLANELTNGVQFQGQGIDALKANNSMPQALSSRILGTAVLADGKEIAIEALPNKP